MGTRLNVQLLVTLLVLFLAAVAEAATVSGTVTNNSGIAGRVFLSGQWSGGGNAGWGKSILVGASGTTNFTIQGAQDGNSYQVGAFLDTQNTGIHHANDPVGTSAPFNISTGSNVSNVNVTLDSPSPALLVQPPISPLVRNGDGGVIIAWDPARDANGREIATAYKVYWSTSANPGPANLTGTSGDIVPAGDSNVFCKGFTNGTQLYFAVTAKLGATESSPVNAGGLVTIGPQTGGFTVSGTVTTTGATLSAATPLYLVMGSNNGLQAFHRIAAPSTSQPFSITGIQPGTYELYVILDMNNNGIIDLGDLSNTNGNGFPVTVTANNVTNANVALAGGNAVLTVRTEHSKQGNNQWYGLHFEVGANKKRPVNASASGPNITGAIDMALSNWGPLEAWPSLGSTRPNLTPTPDTYSFAIEYSDGLTPETLTAPVTGIVDSFATPTSPVGYIPFPFSSGNFTWDAPSSPPTPYTYSFWLNVPGFNDEGLYNMASSTTSATYTNTTYDDGSNYSWQIAVMDNLGNRAQSPVNFTPTSAPAITGFTPTAGIPGTQVTITGFNFGAASANNQVSFNGTAAAITSASSTQLVVTVPDGATSGDIIINNLTTGKVTGTAFPATFTVITPTPPTTTANPAGGTKTGTVNVFLTANEPATIYYTTNGADPTTSSAFFTDTVGNVAKGPIVISSNTTLKFFARDLQGASESIKTEVYFYGTPTTLSLGLSAATIVYGDTVTATATIASGAGPTGTIQFSVDGVPVGAAVPLAGLTASMDITGLQVSGSPHSITATYSGDATYAGSVATTAVTVSKASPTAIISNTPVVYNGSLQTATVACLGGGTATLASGGTGTNVGSYPATIDCAASANYNAAAGLTPTNGPFVINKATPTASITNTPVVYNGALQTATVACLGGGTATLASGGAGTNAGSYTATIDCASSTNYNAAANLVPTNGPFVITKATPTLSVTNSPAVYDGGGKSAAVSASVAGVVSNILTGGAASQTSAGTYAVTANFAPTDTTNYNALTNASAGNFIIAKAAPTATLTNTPVVYNGSLQTATATCLGGGAATLASGGAGTNAGSYPATIDCAASANYNAATGLAPTNDPFVITKATPTLSVANSPVVYDGTAKSATVSASVQGTVSNVLTGGAANQSAIGTYAVTASFVPTDSTNYISLTNAAAGNFVIIAPTQTATVTNSPITYNGSPQAATVTCSGGTASNIRYDNSGTIPTTAGTYAILADCAAGGFYNATSNVSAGNFVINKAAPTLAVTNSPVTYDGTAKAATVTCSSGGATSNILTGGAASQTNAGTYAVTADCATTTNYLALTAAAAGNFVINKATPTVTWGTPANIDYGTLLGNSQLNATASAAGTFTYAQPAGTKLQPGLQTLTATFTPTNATNYTTATASTQVRVLNPTGDITGDGAFNLADALAMLRMSTGVTATQLGLPSGYLDKGDVGPFNGTSVPDGVINSGDAIVMLRKIVGLISWI